MPSKEEDAAAASEAAIAKAEAEAAAGGAAAAAVVAAEGGAAGATGAVATAGGDAADRFGAAAGEKTLRVADCCPVRAWSFLLGALPKVGVGGCLFLWVCMHISSLCLVSVHACNIGREGVLLLLLWVYVVVMVVVVVVLAEGASPQRFDTMFGALLAAHESLRSLFLSCVTPCFTTKDLQIVVTDSFFFWCLRIKICSRVFNRAVSHLL